MSLKNNIHGVKYKDKFKLKITVLNEKTVFWLTLWWSLKVFCHFVLFIYRKINKKKEISFILVLTNEQILKQAIIQNLLKSLTLHN